jgi:hypothetical protein
MVFGLVQILRYQRVACLFLFVFSVLGLHPSSFSLFRWGRPRFIGLFRIFVEHAGGNVMVGHQVPCCKLADLACIRIGAWSA